MKTFAGKERNGVDARCHIEMFGGLRVTQGDRVHTRFRTHKAATLLSYLALFSRQTHSRDELVELFWPDRDADGGRNNLSTALSQLRSQLEPTGVPAGSVFTADRQYVRLNTASVTTDVADFESLIQSATQERDDVGRLERLERAVALYQGDLLPGIYDDWAVREQSRLKKRYTETLRQLARLLERAGRPDEALRLLGHAAQNEPFDEEPYREQIRLCGLLARPAEALEIYRSLETLFRKELGIAPSAETRALVDAQRRDPSGAGGTATVRPQAQAPVPVTPISIPPAASAPAPPPVAAEASLPLQLTRFFGREEELAELREILRTPGTRLISLLGMGGTGKTRLSIELARQSAPDFENRVWFVPLAGLPDASLILSAVARTLDIAPDGPGDPLDRVAAFLAGRPALLVLDNFEHLLRETGPGKSDNPAADGAAALVRLLLERLPELRCVVTSRQPLRLGGEQEYPLSPLGLPSDPSTLSPETLLRNESIALYTDRAQAVRPDFALTANNVDAVAALCRKLEGMPLAIEMAAAWVKTIPPARMLERLETQLDMLVSRRRDLPPRHQSLRATIEYSYDLLAPELRKDFARLSVFRGGWTLDAAEAVCGPKALQSLMGLLEQSLITEREGPDGEPRYRMLEPLREFAAEKRAEWDANGGTEQRHAACFAELVQQAHTLYHTPEEHVWLDRLEQENDNIRAALHYSLLSEQDRVQGLKTAARIWWFWMKRGYITEGRQWLDRILRDAKIDDLSLHSNLLNGAGNLASEQGDLAVAGRHLEEAMRLAQEAGDNRTILTLRNNLAIVAYDSGDIEMARQHWEENLRLTRTEGWDSLSGVTLINLGELLYDEGDFDQAREFLEESLVIRRRGGSTNEVGRTLALLGKVAVRQNDLEDARKFLRESLELLKNVHIRKTIAEALDAVAALGIQRGERSSVACLLAFADQIRERESIPRAPNEQQEYETFLEALKAAPDGTTLTEARQRGRAMTMEEAVEYTLATVLQ
jgi:predicted ATPase/DNA-binding SARP family transcriptional activator/predicted negative regulator of RcsB-dependent stress response